ncbi:IgGFc-binding protein-like isoform X2 [Dysidea avara]
MVEAPGVGFYQTGVINGDSDFVLTLPTNLMVLSTADNNKGIHLKMSSDATLVIGQTVRSFSSDTFFALPYERSTDPTMYYGMSLPGYNSLYHSAILIVGTEDNTTMKLTVTKTATANTGNTLYTGSEYSFVINRLQTFYITSQGDLTGTKIVTDNPVSVFSGHEGTWMPQNIMCCLDVMVEQVPPVTSWGITFYTMPLATRSSYTIKILASLSLTEIVIYCNDSKESISLNEGEHYNKTLSQQESCAIHSNQPVLVVQFSHSGSEEGDDLGDPMMMIIPDTLQFTNTFSVSTIRNPSQSGYTHYINIIVLVQYYQPDMIQLITEGSSTSLNTQEWIPIRVNGIIEAYSTHVIISEGLAEIFHANSMALMTVNIYGFTYIESYGHPGKLNTLATGCHHSELCDDTSIAIRASSASECCNLGGQSFNDGIDCISACGLIEGDPHFTVPLLSAEVLCYSIQGYSGLAFNLVYNENFVINALFVDTEGDTSEATWIGKLAVIPQNVNQSNAIVFDSVNQEVVVVGQGSFKAAMVKKVVFTEHGTAKFTDTVQKQHGNPILHVMYSKPRAKFDVTFHKNHLNVDWSIDYDELHSSHGLMGQFMKKGVDINIKKEMLIYSDGRDPVPVTRDSAMTGKWCWKAANFGNQGEGLIEGDILDYVLPNILGLPHNVKKFI